MVTLFIVIKVFITNCPTLFPIDNFCCVSNVFILATFFENGTTYDKVCPFLEINSEQYYVQEPLRNISNALFSKLLHQDNTFRINASNIFSGYRMVSSYMWISNIASFA